jgi:hypothetical protein
MRRGPGCFDDGVRRSPHPDIVALRTVSGDGWQLRGPTPTRPGVGSCRADTVAPRGREAAPLRPGVGSAAPRATRGEGASPVRSPPARRGRKLELE